MSHRRQSLVITAVAMACTITLAAQEVTPLRTGSGGSPHVRTEWTIDGVHVSIEYGRPYLKGRQESQMMPHGQVWRVGADEQTTLTVDEDLRVGDLLVPAGTYGLHAVPGASEWQLIVSKRTQGWGIPYPAGQDLGRTPMRVSSPPAHAEQLTISIEDTPAGALLHIDWGATRASVPFTVA